MFLSNASIKRPVAMCCLIIALAFLGANAYRKLSLELLPKMDVPYVTVVTTYPGASPNDIEVDVAKKIEDAVTSIDGLKHVTSSCMENVVQTLMEFNVGVDVNVAATDVREEIDQVVDDFPSGVEKPVIMKYDVNATPIATLALTGDLPLDELYDYADNELKDRLSILPGMASVDLIGGADLEVHVLLDRGTLAAAGLSSLQVVQALQNGVAAVPAGRIREHGTEYSVRFDAEYQSIKEIGSLQAAGKDGIRRYLKDLGVISMGSEERRQAAFIDGRPCIGIQLVKKADANAVDVVNRTQKALTDLRKSLPGGMELIWIMDFGSFIQASVDTTTNAIFMGILLTAVILFFFLYNFRTTFVVAVTMPLTVVISLFFMQFLGFTLNQSTLLALGLSVGILVTNAIVVMESVSLRFQMTGDPYRAAREGATSVAVAVMASVGTNVVVLFPIGMMGGVVGIFFRPFAWTVLTVNVVSLFISFTLTPILCSVLLKKAPEGSILKQLEIRFNELLSKAGRRYVNLLRALTSRRIYIALLLLVTFAILVQSFGLAAKAGFNFMSPVDRGEIFIKLEFPTMQDLNESTARILDAEKRLRDLPDLQHIYTTAGKVESIGGETSEGVYLAQIILKLVDKTERDLTADDYLAMVRERMKTFPGAQATISIPGLIGGQQIPVEMEIAGSSLEELERTSAAILSEIKNMDGILEPGSTAKEGKPELRVIPKRAILADMGSEPVNMGSMLRANIDGVKAAVYKRGDRTFDIRVKLFKREGKDQIRQFQVPVGQGKTVILSGFTTLEERLTPVQINRSDKSRVIKILANLEPGLSLGTAVEKIGALIDSRQLLPPGYTYVFRGDYERMQESNMEFLEAGLLAILLTYLALAAILESFTQPFLIMATIPLALIGVFWALYLTKTSITIFVLLGCVMLIGIVVNNAVLIISQMQEYRNQGQSYSEALFNSITMEFRPIIMITLAAVLGMLPLATATGLGSEMSVGIGVASVGGILVSAALTLLIIPAMYLMIHRDKKSTPATGKPPSDQSAS